MSTLDHSDSEIGLTGYPYTRRPDPLDDRDVPWVQFAFLAILGGSALLPFFLMVTQ